MWRHHWRVAASSLPQLLPGDAPNRLEHSDVAEPVHPLRGGQFHGFPGFPGAPAVNQLGFVQPVGGLGQRVVVGVAPAADRGSEDGFGKAFGIAKRQPLQQVNGGFRGRF